MTGRKLIATRVSRAGPSFAPLIRSMIDAGPRVVRRHERRVQTTPDGIRLEEVDGGYAHGLRAENTGAGPARLLIITPGPSAVGVRGECSLRSR